MADYFCDHNAYASALGAVPVWGVPQEGDGSAPGAASAASVCAVNFSAAPTSGAISVCGVTVSTSGVLAAANATAAANALASNINAATALVPAAVAYGTPQLRNLVFARGPANGAPAGTCQVMMRIGSPLLNTANNSAAAIVSTLNNADATPFAGGAGGCFGVFLNTAAALGAGGSIGQRSYGVMASRPYVMAAGGFTAADTLNVRTGRNLTLIAGDNNWGALAARDAYINFVFDDGTVWAGDAPNAKLTVNWYAQGKTITWSDQDQYATYRCRRAGGLLVDYAHSGNYPLVLMAPGNGSRSQGCTLEGVHFVESSLGLANNMASIGMPSYSTRFDLALINCLFDYSGVPRPNLNREFLSFGENGIRPAFLFAGNDFRWSLTGSGAAAVSVPFAAATGGNAIFSFIARGNRFSTGGSYDLQILSLGGQNPGPGTQVVCENNRGAGFPAGPIGIPSALVHPSSAFMVFDNLALGGAAKYETRSGYVGFDPGQPVLTSISPDGTLWSWRAHWTTAANAISPGRPFQMPASRVQSRLAAGVRAWSLDLLLDAVALAQLEGAAVVEVQYVTPAGMPVCDRTPVALQPSGAVWSGATTAPFDTWAARKVTGATSQPVALGSMLVLRLSIERVVAGTTTASLLINPEPSIT